MNELLWALSRGTGVVAWLALSAGVALGVLARSGRSIAGWGRFGANEVHRTTAATALALVVVHVVALLLDTEAGLSLLHVLIPFTSPYAPWGVGLGVLALDVRLALAVTGLLRHRTGPRVFRAVHWSAYALWPLAAGHFLLSGTDAGTWWALTSLVTGSAIVLGSVGWRLSGRFGERGRPVRDADGVLPRSRPVVAR